MADTRKKKAAVEEAHKHISRVIYLSELFPDERLPSATELSQQIGVSRPSILEALKILSDEGVVRIHRGRAGVEVLPSAGGNMKKRIDWLEANRDTVVQMALVREMLEPGIIRHVARRGLTDRMRRTIEKTLDGLAVDSHPEEKRTARVVRQRRALDHQFHLQLAEASKMPLLVEAVTEARAWVAPVFEILEWPSSRDADSYTEHISILDAVLKKDADGAAQAVKKHLDVSTDRIVHLLSNEVWASKKRELLKKAI